MNSAQPNYQIKNYFGQGQWWIVRLDGSFACFKPFATKRQAVAYARKMDPKNFN